jgi:hypothetical protein
MEATPASHGPKIKSNSNFNNIINNNNNTSTNNNINNTIITLFNISTKNLHQLLSTAIKSLHYQSNIPTTPQPTAPPTNAASPTNLPAHIPLPPLPPNIKWRVVRLRTSRFLIPSTSPFYRNPSLIYKGEVSSQKKKSKPSSDPKHHPAPPPPHSTHDSMNTYVSLDTEDCMEEDPPNRPPNPKVCSTNTTHSPNTTQPHSPQVATAPSTSKHNNSSSSPITPPPTKQQRRRSPSPLQVLELPSPPSSPSHPPLSSSPSHRSGWDIQALTKDTTIPTKSPFTHLTPAAVANEERKQLRRKQCQQLQHQHPQQQKQQHKQQQQRKKHKHKHKQQTTPPRQLQPSHFLDFLEETLDYYGTCPGKDCELEGDAYEALTAARDHTFPPLTPQQQKPYRKFYVTDYTGKNNYLFGTPPSSNYNSEEGDDDPIMLS